MIFSVDSTIFDEFWAVVHAVLLFGTYPNGLFVRVYLDGMLKAFNFQVTFLQVDIAVQNEF